MPRPDRTYRTDAIILRRQDFGEADRLLTLFTPEHGKLTAIARGARKPTARQTGHVELFARSTLLIARGRDLDIVTQAELADPFLPLHDNLERAAYANYVVELLDRFTEPGEQNTPLYGLLAAALGWLSEPGCDVRLTTRYYELALLGLVGYQPELFRCMLGHEPIVAQDQFFSAADGGAICPEHAEGFEHPHMISIGVDALKMLRYLQTHSIEAIGQMRLRESIHAELERVTLFYITYLLERRLKSVEFIRLLRRL
jgi:DNA repair protein RecO (recombination protein O)